MRNCLLIIPAIFLAACSGSDSYQELSLEEYRDKMKGAWIGQMAGVGWGLPTEFDYIDVIVPSGEVPRWTPEMINQQGNDDLYVEMTFLASMEKYGTDVSSRQAGIDFANTGYGLWAANKSGRENLRSGIAPPESGHPEYNVNCEDIDYQIEADYSGIIAPGMPGVAVSLGEKFGRIMNYGDGVYAGQFVGGMYAAAYFTDDPAEIIQKGLECIPPQSNYAACIRDVVQWHGELPGAWEQCWERIMDKYYRTLDHQPFHRKHREAWVGIDAKINGAFIVLGLLYGNGNMDSTIIYSMRCGLDSDCNPSNAAGILATTIGYEKLPEKFKSGLDTARTFSYTSYDFGDLLRVSEEFTRRFVVQEGGRIEHTEDGKEVFLIRRKRVVPSGFEPAYDPGPFDPSNRYSEEEMERILAWSHKDFLPLMEASFQGWNIFHAGKNSALSFEEFRGVEEVLVIAPMNAQRGALLEFSGSTLDVNDEGVGTSAEEGGTAVLSFLVNAVKGDPWNLTVRIHAPGGRIDVEETIGSQEAEEWKRMEIPFPVSGGNIPRIRIGINSVEEELNRAYIADLSIRLDLEPVIAGEWRQIAGVPDIGAYNHPEMEPVDFAIWQAADGSWQLVSCIRKCGPEKQTRVLHRWEGGDLTDTNWEPKGIFMESDSSLGEQHGWIQAPYVVVKDSVYKFFYGGGAQICLAEGTDGKNFKRVLREDGKTKIFGCDTYGRARDIMIMKYRDTYYGYYTGSKIDRWPDDTYGAVFCRISDDLEEWGPERMVSETGEGVVDFLSSECPQVHRIGGSFYLFKTQEYMPGKQRTTVFRSSDPLDFGIHTDTLKTGTLPVAAPEVFTVDGKYYMAALMPDLKGIRLAELQWRITD